MEVKLQKRAVLIDLGGVYYTEGFRHGLFAIARRYAVEENSFYKAALQSIFDTGYILGQGTEMDFWAALAKASGLEEDLLPCREIILTAFKPMAEMAGVIEEARRRVPVGLLTDQTNWLYELEERDRFLTGFDAVVSSYEEGFSKRDPEVFRIACQRMGIFPEDAVFFDDNPDNIRTGTDFGVESVLFEGAGETRRVLEDVGIIRTSPREAG